MRSREAEELLAKSKQLFVAAAREDVIIRRVYDVGTTEGMTLGEMALLAVPALLNQIYELKGLQQAVIERTPPKPFIVTKRVCKHCGAAIAETIVAGSWAAFNGSICGTITGHEPK